MSSLTRSAPTRRYALYVRVSDAKQLAGREFNSLESQEMYLRRWVADHSGEVYRVYSDTESGTKYEERVGLVALLDDARARRFDAAVAYNHDRWHRNVGIYISKLKALEVE